ncbi:MAG: transposase [Myxococcota bacterium]
MPKKKSYAPKFKFHAVLDALRSDATDAEVARQHGIHPAPGVRIVAASVERARSAPETREAGRA